MIHAPTPAARLPIRLAMNPRMLPRLRAARAGWFGRFIRPAAPPQTPEKPLFLGVTMQDLREFLMAYCACFMAVMGFIA